MNMEHAHWNIYLVGISATVVFMLSVCLQGFSATSFASILLLQLCLMLWLIRYWSKTELVLPHLFFITSIFLLIWMIISALLQPVHYNGMIGVFFVLGWLFWVVFTLNLKNWSVLRNLLLVGGTVSCVYALYQGEILLTVPVSFFIQPNSHAAFINLLCFVSLGVFSFNETDEKHNRYSRIALYSCLIILYGTLIYTAGRAAILANLAGLVLFFSWLLWNRQRKKVLVIVSCLILGLGLGGTLRDWELQDRMTDLSEDLVVFSSHHDLADEINKQLNPVSERLIIWETALEILQQTPWYGSGYASFHMRYPAYQSASDTSAGQYVHNDYLQLAIEIGIPGLLLGVVLFYLLSKVVWQSIFDRTGNPESGEAIAHYAGIVALYLHSVVTYNLYILPLVFLSGILSGRILRIAKLDLITFNYITGRQILLRPEVIMLPFFLFLFLIVSSYLIMNIQYEKGHTQYKNNHILKSETYFQSAERWFNTENVQLARALVYLSAAQAMTDKQDNHYLNFMTWGTDHLSKAEGLNPWQAEVNYVHGLYLQEFRETISENWKQDAWREFQRALKKNKRYFKARLSMAKLLIKEGNIRQGLEVLEQGLRYPFPNTPDISEYLEALIQLRRGNGFEMEAEQLSLRLESLRAGWAAEPRR